MRSWRQLERRCSEDVAFGALAANQTPDHVTMAPHPPPTGTNAVAT